MKHQTNHAALGRSSSAFFSVAVLFACLSAFAGGGTFTWSGGSGTTGNWTDGANWGGTAPSDPQNFLNFNGAVRTLSTNDFANGSPGQQLYFKSGANAFTLYGNSITFYDFGSVDPNIQNEGAFTNQTVNFPIVNGNTHGVNGILNINLNTGTAQGPLIFNGNITAADAAVAIRAINVSGTNSVKFNGVISDFSSSGKIALTLLGTNTTTLATNNTYSGATTISAGTLQLGNGTIDGSISNSTTIIDNAALVYNLVGSQTYSNVISGSGTLTKTGIGTLILSGANTYSGGTTLNTGGTLALGNKSALGAGALNVSGASTIQAMIDLSGANRLLNNITEAGNLTVNGSQNLELAGVFTSSGAAGRTLTVANSATTTLSSNVYLAPDNTTARGLTLDGAGAVVVTGNIANNNFGNTLASALTINNAAAVVTLSGSNTYSGATTLSAGTVRVNSTNAFGASSLVSMNGVTLDNTTGAAITNANNNPISLGANNTFTGTKDLNLGTGAVTLTATRTWTVNAGTLTLGGVVSGTGFGVTKLGAGALTLSAANAYTGVTTASGGALNLTGSTNLVGGIDVNTGGTLTLAGTFGTTVVNAVHHVGQAGGKGTLNIPTGVTINWLNWFIGDSATGDGAVYQTGGSVTMSQAAGIDNLRIGSSASGKGYYKLSGGTLTAIRPAIGASLTDTIGVMDVTGGTFASTEQLHIAGGSASSSGLLNVLGGTVNAGTDIRMFQLQAGGTAGATQLAILNVGGGVGLASVTTINSGLNGVNLAQAGNVAGELSVVNLLANGTLTTGRILGTQVNPTTHFNFNGGTLKATAINNVTIFGDANLDAVNIYSGGGAIDNSGTGITIDRGLLAPTGTGVSSIPVPSIQGSGYIGAPLVKITGGTGSGATAYAVMADDGTGNNTFKVSSIVVTSPGLYTVVPTTVTLLGGGAVTAASGFTINTAANLSGGLTFNGSGTNTLSGPNTYTGNTVISNGVVALAGSATLPSSIKVAVSGATFDVSGLTALPFTVSAGKTLSGVGTVKGSIAMASTATLSAGNGIGTITLLTNLTLNAGSTNLFELGTSAAGGNDKVVVGGTLTANASTIYISATNGAANLDQSADYVLFTATAGVSGLMASTPVFLGTAPANAAHFTVGTSGASVVLHYNVNVPPSGSGSASPASLVRNQRTTVSVIATPGSDPISTVTLNASSIGGPSAVSMVQSNLSNLYTNDIAVSGDTTTGSKTLVATVTDTSAGAGSVNIALNITASAEIWDGGSASDDNFSSNTNWVTDRAPGQSGDSLTFAGTTRLTPNMETNYNITSLTFSNTAGSFNLGTANSSALTLTGGVTNNSTAAQTLNVPVILTGAQTLSAAAGDLAFLQSVANGGSTISVVGLGNILVTGPVSGGGGLSKTSSGTLTLSGTNTFSGNTTVSAGTLTVSGNGAITTAATLRVGLVGGQSAAMYQSGANTVVNETNQALGSFDIGSAPGAYGYYNLTAGTINIGNAANGGELDPGGASGGAGTFGQFDMSGGTVNLPNHNPGSVYFLPNRGASGESSVVNLSGGTVQVTGGGTPLDTAFNGLSISFAAGQQTNVTTISGSAQFLTPSLTVKLNQGSAFNAAGSAANLTALNLNGGILQTLGFRNGGASNNVGVNLNFNGGTLKAGTATNSAFLVNLGGTYIYSGGATIDDNGRAITIGQALLTPSGNGVASIPVAAGGAGYIVPPQVQITGGGGSNATASATISAGVVTGITVTSPGNNYSSLPTVTLAGGGFTTAATVGAVTTAANTSGGLTKSGAGTLTLTGGNSFAGNLNVNTGTLAASLGNNSFNPTTSALGNPQAVRNLNVNSGGALVLVSPDSLGSANSTIAATLVINSGGVVSNLGGIFNTFGPVQLNGGTLTGIGGAITGYQMYNLRGSVTVGGATASTISGSGTFAGYHLAAPTTFNVADVTNGSDLNVSGIFVDQDATDSGSGSLVKTGAGTMTLTGASTYTGSTIISNGTLSIKGGGSIAGSPTIILNSNALLDVSASSFALGANQTLKGNGLVNGVITNNGIISPGASIGTLTFSNSPALNGTLAMEINVTNGQTSDLLLLTSGALNYGGALIVTNLGPILQVGDTFTLFSATSYTGGFTNIVLPPLAGALVWNTNNLLVNGSISVGKAPTVLNLVSSSNPSGYLDTLAFTAAVTPTNATGVVIFYNGATPISTNSLTLGIATSGSLNSLPRGTNSVTATYSGDATYSTSTSSLSQIVTNHPPVASAVNYYRVAGINTLRIKVADLLTNVTDADGDIFTLTAAGVSTNGITLLNSSGFLLYQNTNNVNDLFTYTVDDANGGITTGNVKVVVQPFVSGQNASVTVSGSTATVSFNGIPGYSYGVQRSTNLTVWTTLVTTNAPSNGAFNWTDDFNDLGVVPGSAYYRLQWNP